MKNYRLSAYFVLTLGWLLTINFSPFVKEMSESFWTILIFQASTLGLILCGYYLAKKEGENKPTQ